MGSILSGFEKLKNFGITLSAAGMIRIFILFTGIIYFCFFYEFNL